MGKDRDGMGWTLRSEWLDPTRWVRRPRPETVRHRGFLYPRTFEATWVRDDGLEVDLVVEVRPDLGPVPLAATIRAPGGIATEYRQPIPSMARQAAAQIALNPDGRGGAGPVPAGTVMRMGRSRVKTDETRLRRVADLYRAALAEGHRVTKLIEDEEHVSDLTAYGLIAKARKAGYLPRTAPGRKGAQ